jgi:hypothetical protein
MCWYIWKKMQTPWPLGHKRTIPTERRPLVCKVSAKFCWLNRVSQLVPTAVNLDFLDRSRYIFIQVGLQLSSRNWVDPVPHPIFPETLVWPGIEPETLDLYPGTLTTRPQMRSHIENKMNYMKMFSRRWCVWLRKSFLWKPPFMLLISVLTGVVAFSGTPVTIGETERSALEVYKAHVLGWDAVCLIGMKLQKCKIWGFHGGDYEEWCLLGCYAVWLL